MCSEGWDGEGIQYFFEEQKGQPGLPRQNAPAGSLPNFSLQFVKFIFRSYNFHYSFNYLE